MKIKKILLVTSLLGAFAAIAAPKHLDTSKFWADPYTRLAYYARMQDDTIAAFEAAKLALKKDKNNYVIHDLLVNLYSDMGDSVNALKSAEKLIKLSEGTDVEAPANVDYAYQLLEVKKDTAGAITYALKATRLEGDQARANALLAHLFGLKKDFEKVKAYYQNALNYDNSPNLYFLILSELPVTDPDYSFYVKKAIESTDGSAEDSAEVYKIVCSSKVQANEEAGKEVFPFEEIVNDAISAAKFVTIPGSEQPLLMCLDTNSKRTAEIIEAYCRKSTDGDVNNRLYQFLSEHYRDRKEFKRALECTYRGLNDASDKADFLANRNIVKILYDMSAYEDCIGQLDPDSAAVDDLHVDLDQMPTLAFCYEQLGDPRRAKAILDYYQEQNGDHYEPSVTLQRGSLAMQMGNYDGAAFAYKELCDSSTLKNFVPALSVLGDAYSMGGHKQQAIEVWQQAADAMYNDEMCKDDARCWLPMVLHSLGRTKEAEDYVSRLIAANDFDEHILYNLACYYTRAGKYDEALNWLHEALDHGYDPYHPLVDYDLAPLRDNSVFRSMTLEAQKRLRKTVKDARQAAN